MKRNQLTLELIHTQIREDELCHMTPEEKKAYNAQYYQRNKEKYWGVTGNRPVGRQKYVTEGNGQGVQRRGAGLGSGYVGSVQRPSASRGVHVSDASSGSSKDRRQLERTYQNKIEERNTYARSSEKLKKRYEAQLKNVELYKRTGNEKKYQEAKSLAEQTKQEYEWYDRLIDEYDRVRIPAAKEALARYDSVSEMHSSGQMNPNKPSAQAKKTDLVKQKIKSKASQASSDWKSGSKTVKQLASDSVAKGKSIAASIFSKFKK